MSQLTLYLDRAMHVRALKSAETRAPSMFESAEGRLVGDGLYAPLPDDARHWLGRLWGVVTQALLLAATEGYEKAKPVISEFNNLFQQAQADLGIGLLLVRDELIGRMNAYIKALIKLALGSVEAIINVGGRDMQVTTVTLQQSLKMSGSVSLSITDICQFVSEGQLIISAQYGSVGPGGAGS